jgi:hypothetical protein
MLARRRGQDLAAAGTAIVPTGSKSHRKERYASLLAAALDLTRVPPP